MFTPLRIPNEPGADPPVATGIDDLGQITGSFDATAALPGIPRSGIGFVDTAGAVATFAVPGETSARPAAINNRGEVAGTASDERFGPDLGFVDIGGRITTFRDPGATDTVVTGIDDLGQVVGEYYTYGTFVAAGPFVATPVPQTGDGGPGGVR